MLRREEGVTSNGWEGGGGVFLSRSDPQIKVGAQTGVKGTRRSLEITFFPLQIAFFLHESATFSSHHLIALNGKAFREKLWKYP